MKILITGGAGFVGSYLANTLCETQNKIYVLDDLSSGKKNKLNKKIKFFRSSILNKKKINSILFNCDILIHLAAFVQVEESIHNPKKCISVNINGIENILSCKNIVHVKKIIFASSCSVYGDNFKNKLSENSSLNPTSPYAISKLVGEILIKNFSDKYKKKYIILRCFNIYGDNNENSKYSAVISKFISESIIKNKITIHGNGKQTRDFIHIKDVVDIYAKMIKSPISGTFNVGSGKSTTIRSIAEILRKINKNLSIGYNLYANTGIKKSIASLVKLRRFVRFKPDQNFENNIRSMYIRQQKERQNKKTFKRS
jgi:UDP-glucose 4-epimerase